MGEYKKHLKPKYIVVALALIGGVYAYHSFSKERIKETAKETAIGLAKDAGKYAVDKAKEKLKERMEGGAVLSQGQESVPEPTTAPAAGKTLDDFVNGTATVQKTQLKGVDSSKYLSIDDVSVTPDQADLMLMNAIKSVDLDRVKYLVSSGVKIDFSDDKICARNPYGGGEFSYGNRDYNQHEMPTDTMSMKKIMKYIDPAFMFTTDCKKLFLLTSFYSLSRTTSEAEFEMFIGTEALQSRWKQELYKTMNENGIKNTTGVYDALLNGEGQFKALKDKYFAEKKEELVKEQKAKREIFDYLLSLTPKKDYYQFVHAIGNTEIPQDLRVKLANLYIENVDSMPVSASRKKFLGVYETAILELLQESPANKDWLNIAVAYKAPLYNHFANSVYELTNMLAESLIKQNSYMNAYKGEKRQRPTLSEVVLPELDVKATSAGRYDPYIKGVTDEVKRFADPRGYTNYKEFYSSEKMITVYLANRELEIIKLLMNSGKVNLNLQDAEGKSILHQVVSMSETATGGADRARAIVVRFLLNSGVNPGLLDKKGNSAHATLIAQENEYNRVHSSSNASAVNKEIKNAFTLKTYN